MPEVRAEIVDRAVLRGRHVALVEVRPVSYNPVAGTIEVLSRVQVRLRFAGGSRRAADAESARLASPLFDPWIDERVVALEDGPATSSTRDTGGASAGALGLLVVAHDDFVAAVEPWLDWKRRSGYRVELVRTSDLGASPTDVDVKAAIQAAYDTWSAPALDFVLLVGDTDFTPIHNGNGGGSSQVTDNWYACVDGTDYLPDVAIARISTRTSQETADVVAKLTTYERATFAETSWTKTAGFIGTDDPGYIGMIEGTHDWCIESFYTPNGYLPTPWSHGGTSSDRHYNSFGATTAQIAASVDAGRSLVNYSGHGWSGGWSGPTSGGSYDQDDVRGNVNGDMYPFVISNACQTGMLGVTECFAETWQKAPGGGAIAFWGASNNSYWGEDDVLQRAVHDNLFPMDATPSLGVAVIEAKLDLYAHYGATGTVAYYFDMYNLLADPSVTMWTREPRDLEVIHDAARPVGESTLQVAVRHGGAAVPGALVAVRKSDEGVFESGFTDSQGAITLSLDPAPQSVGAMELTVTGHDYRPYEDTVEVVSPDAPYLLWRHHAIDDSAGGDGDGSPNPGETVRLAVTVENVGGQPGTDLTGTLTTTSPAWSSVVDGQADFPDAAPQSQVTTLPDHFAVAISDDARDGVALGFDLHWQAGDGSSGTTSFSEIVRAVDFAFGSWSVDDGADGDGNGLPGPGETVDMTVVLRNVGHRDASGITATLTAMSPYVTLIESAAAFADVPQGAEGASLSAFRFSVAADAPDQQPLPFTLAVSEAGSGHEEVLTFEVLASTCVTVHATDVPLSLVDNGTTVALLDHPRAVAIDEVNAFVDVTHPYRGDLSVELVAPSGTAVTLHDRSGGSTHDLVTWYDTETQPVDSLDAFVGQNAFGPWRLVVDDHTTGNSGVLNDWAIEVCGSVLPPQAILEVPSFAVDDQGTCDPDGVGDVGETVVYRVDVRNAGWTGATRVRASMTSTAPVAVRNNPVTLPDLPPGAMATAPFEVMVGAAECLEPATFTVELLADEGLWTRTFADVLERDVFHAEESDDLEHGGAEPPGWSHAAVVGTDVWSVDAQTNHTAGGAWSWFAPDTYQRLDDALVSPPLALAGTSTLEFWHGYDLEPGEDGAVLEISVDGGAWVDLGGSMTAGGYSGSIGSSSNPLFARAAWTGTAGGWARTEVDLSAWTGSSVRFRWRMACDLLGERLGWWVDDVRVVTHDEVCDAHACGVPGETRITSVSREGSATVLRWEDDPLCTSFRVWRATDPDSAGAFTDVTAQDGDPTDCVFHDLGGDPLVFWIVEAIGPDGAGPWGHFGQ